MSRELPKPIQDAIARQTSGEVHPSPDVLTAFAEQNLHGRESERVTDHLTRCADCRDVVFLANRALEESLGGEQEWMPADAIARIPPGLRAKSVTSQTGAGMERGYVPTRRRRMWRWAWVPAVAAVLIVAGILFQRGFEPKGAAPLIMASKGASPAVSQPSTTAAPVRESEPQSAPGIEATLVAPESLAKSAHTKADQARTTHSLVVPQSALKAEEYAAAPTADAAPPAPSSPTGASASGSAKSPPAAFSTLNSFAQSEDRGVSSLAAKPQPLLGNSQMETRGFGAAHTHWHVTPDGHLERWTATGSWTRALAEQPIKFHVVSVVGDDVWAGGSAGALFHSSDGGQNWSRQPIGSPGVETETIVAIRFSDMMHGVVTTQSGTRWSTSDGGLTWTKE